MWNMFKLNFESKCYLGIELVVLKTSILLHSVKVRKAKDSLYRTILKLDSFKNIFKKGFFKKT